MNVTAAICGQKAILVCDIDNGLGSVKSLKKDGERSKGKGRRCCLGDRMASIPCHASCFASVYLEKTVEFIMCQSFVFSYREGESFKIV